MTRGTLTALLVALATFVLFLILAVNTAGADWVAVTVDPSVIATDLNGHDLQVIRTADTSPDFSGHSFIGGLEGKIWLSPRAYRDAARGGARGILVLLHEVGHTVGIADERQATCYGLARLRSTLSAYFGFSRVETLARYRTALVFLRHVGPPYSEGACL